MKSFVRYIPAVVWMVVIFYLSHQPGDDLGNLLPIFQKLLPMMSSFDWGHFLAYFILAITYYLAIVSQQTTWRTKLAIVFMCILFGITDEYHQSFIPERMPDFHDLRNDAIGAALAMLFVSIPAIRRKIHRWHDFFSAE